MLAWLVHLLASFDSFSGQRMNGKKVNPKPKDFQRMMSEK